MRVGGSSSKLPDEIRGEPQLVAGTTQERGLDEVVTQDLAAERLAPRQAWQTAMPGEGRNADDGVVAPGVAIGHLPKGQTVAEHRAVQAGRELEDAGEQRFAVDGERRRLHQGHALIGLHDTHHPGHGLCLHQAVGVQQHHIAITPAPTADEFRDIAGLLGGVVLAIAVEDPPVGIQVAGRLVPQDLLFDPGIGVARVAQHEELEVLQQPGVAQGFVHGSDPGKDAHRVLVVGGHDERRSQPRVPLGRRPGRSLG